jgi:hypothetical protein
MAHSSLFFGRVSSPSWVQVSRPQFQISNAICLWGSSLSWSLFLKALPLYIEGGFCPMSVPFSALYRFLSVYQLTPSCYGNVRFLLCLFFLHCAFSSATDTSGIGFGNPGGGGFLAS